MVEATSVTKWLDDYKRAWERQDPDLIAKLFTDDGQYFETPFLVHAGRDKIREYWQLAPGGQSDIQFQYQLLTVFDDHAFAHWSARFKRQEEEIELDGLFVLEFDSDGLCRTLREWWHARLPNC